MKLLELTPSVFRDYRSTVKGNEDITYDAARKKITRNVMLAKKLEPRNQEDIDKGNILYQYGNLEILVKNETVIHIKNHKGKNVYSGWELDRFKYVDLSRELNIVNE